MPFLTEMSFWVVLMRMREPPVPTVPVSLLTLSSSECWRGEVGFDVAFAGFGLDGEVGVLGDRDVDLAVAVLDGEVAHRGGRQCDVYGSVAGGDGDVSGYAIEGDVVAAGR